MNIEISAASLAKLRASNRHLAALGLKRRVKTLENEVATLQRDAHPPADLRPAIEDTVRRMLARHGTTYEP